MSAVVESGGGVAYLSYVEYGAAPAKGGKGKGKSKSEGQGKGSGYADGYVFYTFYSNCWLIFGKL